MSTILLTGYEPFGEFEVNPAAQLAADLDGHNVGDTSIVGRELPVAFDRAHLEIEDLIGTHDPEVVLSVGLAAGRSALSLERIGINLRDTAGTPDNDDRDVVDEPVAPDGPDAYFSSLPVREMCETMCKAGVPTTLSTAAGTHLCNDVLYATRHLLESQRESGGQRDHHPEITSGFLHVPLSHAQAATREETAPSMSLEAMKRGTLAGLEAALEARTGDAGRR